MEEIRVLSGSQLIRGYGPHTHAYWEIILYLEGDGTFCFGQTRVPIRQGTVIVVPPGVVHSSTSVRGYRNIAVVGDFCRYFLTDTPVVLEQTGEAETLAVLLWDNRYAGKEYLSALCTAYICCLLQKVQHQDKVAQAVARITAAMTRRFSDPELDVPALLDGSGYARDYIRAKFRELTGQTPNGYLTRMRIDHGRNLLDTYGQSISVAEAALVCGFTDPVYFSRRFKQLTGICPEKYRGGQRAPERAAPAAKG